MRTKQYLRCKFYWPNMDLDVERIVRDCAACKMNQPLQEDQPLQPLELPPRPWTKLGIDLVRPIRGEYILTVIDYFSSFPEAVVVADIFSQTVIADLLKMFARFGYPSEVVTDSLSVKRLIRFLRMEVSSTYVLRRTILRVTGKLNDSIDFSRRRFEHASVKIKCGKCVLSCHSSSCFRRNTYISDVF